MIVISLACTVLLVGVWLVLWAADHRPPSYRTPGEVEADVAAYRAQRRMRESVDSLRTCREIYNLPTLPNPRKETGQ